MNCAQFETRLNLVLDQRRSPADDPALSAHTANCPDCDQLLADHTALVSCVLQMRSPAPSNRFAHRAVAATTPLVVRHWQYKRAWMALGVALSAAAAMLLAISVVWKARQASSDLGNQVAVQPESTAADSPLDSPQRAAGWHLNQFALAVPGDAFDEMEKLAPGFRPLRESIALIWDALRRALPGTRESKTPPPEDQTNRSLSPLFVFDASIA